MSEELEVRQRYNECNKFVIWNSLSACAECDEESNNENEISDNVSQDYAESNKINMNNEIEKNIIRRVGVNKIKCKSKFDQNKKEGVAILFSANCNGFGSPLARKM